MSSEHAYGNDDRYEAAERRKIISLQDELDEVKHNRDVLIGAMRSIIEEVDRVRSITPGRVTLDEALVTAKSTAVMALMHVGEEWPGKKDEGDIQGGPQNFGGCV